MNKVLGIIDALEALVLDAKKIPFTDYVMVPEQKILMMIEKLRATTKDVAASSLNQVVPESHSASEPEPSQLSQIQEDLEKVSKDAKKIKSGANEYADNMLANLLLIVTRMQKNLMTMEQSLENGRKLLDVAKSRFETEGETK